jgi:hypothetical protein
MKHLLFLILACCLITRADAQLLEYGSNVSISLSDGTVVECIRQMSDEMITIDKDGKPNPIKPMNNYYYLPTNLRLGSRPDGIPEFLFTKFTTESRTGVSGAIMHFLMQWGLTEAQTAELELAIQKKTNNKEAKVMGTVDLSADKEGGSFQIISATLSDKSMATAILNGSAPVVAGGKVAIATRLTADGAQLLASSFEKAKSIADLSIELRYKYTVIIPAFKAKMIYDWSRLKTMMDTSSYSKTEKSDKIGAWWANKSSSSVSESEFRSFTDSLMEKKIVYLDMLETTNENPEKVAAIRTAFLDMFIKQFTVANENPEMSQSKIGSAKPQSGTLDKIGDAGEKIMETFSFYSDKSKSVTVKNSFHEKVSQGKREEINFQSRLPLTKEFPLTGNLASWYNGVRDNKSCVNSVNLNDPFFQYRDIRFIMDLEGKEMFEKEVNYVTINARKKRSVGNSFSDRVTMDAKYFSEKGIQASMTYARGEDKDPDAYEYMTQWSLRGGNVYPTEPVWIKGQWEGVTLTPPVKPVNIDFEADIDELKTGNFTRVILQIRYSKFGVEVEENIPISVAKNEGMVSKQIYMDRTTKGYAYRLVFNNKESGKMATEFSSKINDNYVYANIPAELKDKSSPGYVKAIEAAKSIAQPSADGKVTAGKVLDTFKDIFGTVTVIKGK